ncbi:hypothetical protein FN846DRAFT_983722 [Sphaerosporella brunnea]|uniref:Uncharacterized protein n=1 Tax=Sphaerosporella brunnea TaxID=1250544 RepID=A0A5J5EVL9_9PEZI|nr:hypothetical protein FN846DRAFT_983722 [Sphaerosporella brunnea]
MSDSTYSFKNKTTAYTPAAMSNSVYIPTSTSLNVKMSSTTASRSDERGATTETIINDSIRSSSGDPNTTTYKQVTELDITRNGSPSMKAIAITSSVDGSSRHESTAAYNKLDGKTTAFTSSYKSMNSINTPFSGNNASSRIESNAYKTLGGNATNFTFPYIPFHKSMKPMNTPSSGNNVSPRIESTAYKTLDGNATKFTSPNGSSLNESTTSYKALDGSPTKFSSYTSLHTSTNSSTCSSDDGTGYGYSSAESTTSYSESDQTDDSYFVSHTANAPFENGGTRSSLKSSSLYGSFVQSTNGSYSFMRSNSSYVPSSMAEAVHLETYPIPSVDCDCDGPYATYDNDGNSRGDEYTSPDANDYYDQSMEMNYSYDSCMGMNGCYDCGSTTINTTINTTATKKANGKAKKAKPTERPAPYTKPATPSPALLKLEREKKEQVRALVALRKAALRVEEEKKAAEEAKKMAAEVEATRQRRRRRAYVLAKRAHRKALEATLPAEAEEPEVSWDDPDEDEVLSDVDPDDDGQDPFPDMASIHPELAMYHKYKRGSGRR